jgi:hypothetical protein
MSSHKELDDYIQNVYGFKQVWKDKCSKYDVESQPDILPPVKRIIVIGDIHGDWEMTLQSLQIAKLVDKNGTWIGGDTVVVQVGDQVDRCRYSGVPCNQKGATNPDEGNDWKILQYFTQLNKEAQKVGGAVYSLIGNHELANVRGDLRYVSYEGLKEFDNYKKPDGTGFKDGKDARLWAFDFGNPISEFLACTRQVALIIGSNLFVHGGILPKIAKKYSVRNLNQLMTLYLLDKLKPDSSSFKQSINSNESPLWTRIYGNMGLQQYSKNTQHLDLDSAKDKCSSLLNPLKEIYKVDKIFVGHTPLLDHGIGSVCDGKVWLTDYGLSKAFDKFDKNLTMSDSSDQDYHRTSNRKAHVLEILDDGKEINILK